MPVTVPSLASRLLSACVLLTILAGCGLEITDSTAETLRNSSEMTLSGSVGDGPIVDAAVTIRDARGEVVAISHSDGTANYRIEVPALTAFPLEVTAEGGTDLVSGAPADFTLTAAVLDPDREVVNLSPFTTLVSRGAACLPGGVDAENIEALWERVHARWSMGFDPALMPDPLHGELTRENAAAVVYANEGLAEVIRRSHRALQGSEAEAGTDELIERLACDLADGGLDGSGSAVERRTAAAFVAAAAGVQLEMLAYRLHVKGADAMAALNDSLATIMPQAEGLRVEEVPVTASFLEQTRRVLGILEASLQDEVVQRYGDLLEGATPEGAPRMVAEALDAGDRSHLDGLSARFARGPDAELESRMSHLRDGDESVEEELAGDASIRLTAMPEVVELGDTAELEWSSEAVSECTASGGWSGSRATDGSAVVGPLERDTTFTLSCSGANGSAMAMASIGVRVARLQWEPPQTTVDGEPLEDLAGFRIHYGRASRSYATTIELSDPQERSFELSLPPGTYYFAMTAFTAQGDESEYSNELRKTID